MPAESPDDLHDGELQKWMNDVRDPATKASEGVRTIRAKDASAEYEIAPLPDGRWAVRLRASYEKGTSASLGTPWVAFPTREDCLACVLETARDHFGECRGHTLGEKKAAERMRQKLGTGVCFLEPPAVPRPEQEAGEDKVERMRRERKVKLKREMPLFADLLDAED